MVQVDQRARPTDVSRARSPRGSQAAAATTEVARSVSAGPTLAPARRAATGTTALDAALQRCVQSRTAAGRVSGQARSLSVQRFGETDIVAPDEKKLFRDMRDWYQKLAPAIRAAFPFDELQAKTTWSQFRPLLQSVNATLNYEHKNPPLGTAGWTEQIKAKLKASHPQIAQYLGAGPVAVTVSSGPVWVKPGGATALPKIVVAPIDTSTWPSADAEGAADHEVQLSDLQRMRDGPNKIEAFELGVARKTSEETVELRMRVQVKDTAGQMLVLIHYHPSMTGNYLHLKSVADVNRNVRITSFDHPLMVRLGVTKSKLDAAT